MLVAQNITKRFSGVTALNQVNMHLAAGKVTAIIGENGAGKSTLMKVLSGVYDDYEGQLIYKGAPVRFKNTAGSTTGRYCHYPSGAKFNSLSQHYRKPFSGSRDFK
jgi:ABC-type sugar transport system ATPase subunit